jgi:hypothetical protein
VGRELESIVTTKDAVKQACEPVSAVTAYQTGPPVDKILVSRDSYPMELRGQLTRSKKKVKRRMRRHPAIVETPLVLPHEFQLNGMSRLVRLRPRCS